MSDFRYVAETISTNDDAGVLAMAGADEGLWLRAGVQTGGRGRQGRAWGSFEGNLHASTLVRITPGDPAPATLALVAAVALHETVVRCGVSDARLKWPNDLLVGKAKLSGILLERHGPAIVIGFGVNLARHPEGLERPVTSLPAIGVTAPDPDLFLRDLAICFKGWLGRWRREGLAPVRTAWLAAAHPIGTPLAVQGGGGLAIQGLFDGLEESGGLRLRLADGSCHVMHAGEVFLI